MKIALVYDCLYPYTVGGAERWYRSLAERLAAGGHEVTYVTMRQWERGTTPALPGVEVVAVGPRLSLYSDGRRRILPPVLFGLGVLAHLARPGRRYDIVHSSSFPYFSLLAAAAIRPLRGYALFVDWLEVWTREYWREYLGRFGGRIGWAVQRLCIRVKHQAFCLSELHARRLRELGIREGVTVLGGLYAGPLEPPEPEAPEEVVVFAGRHIPEKRVTALPPALALARAKLPRLRGEIYGDGPDRAEVLRLIEAHGLEGVVEARGFVSGERVRERLARALCLVLPSQREGYGLVVVEAAAVGTPSIVVRDPDSAATDLIEDGRNGVIAESAEPEELASAILRVHAESHALRASTRAWFRENADRLSLESSAQAVLRSYALSRERSGAAGAPDGRKGGG